MQTWLLPALQINLCKNRLTRGRGKEQTTAIFFGALWSRSFPTNEGAALFKALPDRGKRQERNTWPSKFPVKAQHFFWGWAMEHFRLAASPCSRVCVATPDRSRSAIPWLAGGIEQ